MTRDKYLSYWRPKLHPVFQDKWDKRKGVWSGRRIRRAAQGCLIALVVLVGIYKVLEFGYQHAPVCVKSEKQWVHYPTHKQEICVAYDGKGGCTSTVDIWHAAHDEFEDVCIESVPRYRLNETRVELQKAR